MSDTNDSWPAWYYGPNNASQIFDNEDQVPEGWADHPSKLDDEPKARQTEADKAKDTELAARWEGKSDADVQKELRDRKIEFGQKWPRTKLVALLVADDKKKG